MERAARALPSVCSGQQGKVDEVPEQRLVAGIRTANICAPLRKVRSPILCTAPACWPRIASDSRSSYVMPRRQSPATAGPPPPTPPSRPRVSGKNTTPPPTTAGGALPSPKPQWLYAAVHGSEGALRTSHRLALDHQTAESMHRITRLNHSPHPAPALCSTQCAGARQRRSVRHSRVRERLAERHGLRQLKKLAWIQMTPSNPYHSQNTIAVCPLFTEFHIQTVCALARGVARTWHTSC